MIRPGNPLARTLLAALFVGLVPLALPAMDVELKTGSVRSGEPDASTNEATLRLRVGDPDGYIVFGIPWDEIAEIREGAIVWNLEQFDEVRNRIAQIPIVANDLKDRPGLAAPIGPAGGRPPALAQLAALPNRPNSRIRFLEVDAVAASWDASVEWDGLTVRVWPKDQFGDAVPVPGTLEVTLIANEPGWDGRWHGDDNQRIGHWVARVAEADFFSDGSVGFPFEFQNHHPERTNAPWHPDSFIPTFAEVHVKFAVPAHGVFRASTGPVRIRRFSPLRDNYFRRTGSRFFHFER